MADKGLFSRLQRLFSTDVIIRNTGGNQIKVIDVEEGQTHVTASNLQDGVYIVRFMRKNQVLGMRKLKVIG